MEHTLKALFKDAYQAPEFPLPYLGLSEQHHAPLKSLLKSFHLASVALAAGQHLLIKAGSGKSAFVELLAHAFERQLVALSLSSSSDANDLIGSYEQTAQDQAFLLKKIQAQLIAKKEYEQALELPFLPPETLFSRYPELAF